MILVEFENEVILELSLNRSHRRQVLEEIQAGLRRILAEKNMENVSFEVREVKDLPVDAKTGKFRLILPPENRPRPEVRRTPVARPKSRDLETAVGNA